MLELNLAQGRSQVHKCEFQVGETANSDPATLQVDVDRFSNKIVMYGLKPGVSYVQIRELGKSGPRQMLKVHVLLPERGEGDSSLLSQLRDIRGISIHADGTRFTIEGTVSSEEDYARVIAIAMRNEDVTSNVRLIPQTLEQKKEAVRQQLDEQGFRRIKVMTLNGELYVEGVVSTVGRKSKIKRITTDIEPDAKIDIKVVEPE